MAHEEFLDVKATTLDNWLELLRNPPAGKIFVRNMFPTDAHRDEWLKTAHRRSESQVKLLLRRFLVSTGSSPADEFSARLAVSKMRGGASIDDLSEHDRRLVLHVGSEGTYPVWEGIGWIIDLLPQHPRMALNVIDAFFYANYDRISDHYLSGLFDAQLIIRNRYIESPHTKDPATKALLGLDWRELEWLCAVIYEHMGFQVVVTSRGNDDGVDVFAANQEVGYKGLAVIQAKKWRDSNPVGKKEIRELHGTITIHHATKGILITTGRYEPGALEMAENDPRIELLDQEQIIQLLNEYCGSDWYVKVDRLINSLRTVENTD